MHAPVGDAYGSIALTITTPSRGALTLVGRTGGRFRAAARPFQTRMGEQEI
jgi:hypothetical protein